MLLHVSDEEGRAAMAAEAREFLEKTRGGARKGAGRKPGYRKPNAKRNQVNVRLTDAQMAAVNRLGNGNASAGLRALVDRAIGRG
jgi:hypothetical protein